MAEAEPRIAFHSTKDFNVVSNTTNSFAPAFSAPPSFIKVRLHDYTVVGAG